MQGTYWLRFALREASERRRTKEEHHQLRLDFQTCLAVVWEHSLYPPHHIYFVAHQLHDRYHLGPINQKKNSVQLTKLR